MKRGLDLSWLKDWRIAGPLGLLAGFLIGLLMFGEPWHLKPDWGDIPTWLLFTLGLPGLYQLSVFVQTNAEEARRNIKRDELLDRQLAEAADRAVTDRRRLAEDIEVSLKGAAAVVTNNSRRPISDVTCAYMSSVDRKTLASPRECGILAGGPDLGGRQIDAFIDVKPVSRLARLRPGSRCAFTFEKGLKIEPDFVLVAWFTDDAGFRWQLDEDLRLVPAGDESEYLL